MTTVTRSSYAPRTRAGLLISSLGFAALAAPGVAPAMDAAVSPVMGIGFVAAILLTSTVPRLIRPGRTWFRAPVQRGFATAVFVGSAVVALIAATLRVCHGPIVWGHVATAVLVLGAVVVAALPPEGTPRRRP